MGLFSFLTQDIAVDLGTANTIIICNDKMVVNEPSIVAIDRKTEKVIAIGEKARQMQERHMITSKPSGLYGMGLLPTLTLPNKCCAV